MVSIEKVRHMTAVALLWKKGEHREAEAVKYRQNDYVALHMFGIWISGSAAWILMTAALLIFVLGKDPDQYIAFETLGSIVLLWGMAYLIFCVILEWIAWMCYSVRYRNAKGWQRKYHYALRSLERYYSSPEEEEDDENWLVNTGEGSKERV